ncbi:AI-2E family transporter [Butyrivibrio sp. CB08]|uniref:AI-2E family transporter n=1 Tax=Butyrivibrio sp. CB08 TaxID=2364879 RepID=UPI000EA88ECE|nr:AI-2E family transporter [Butyrivibrio sp. CB08]RKM62275.1 AI-2E family transporter [Butyrivibrio sp. CB08]
MKFSKKILKQKWVSYTIATCSAVVLYLLLSNQSFLSGTISGIVKIIKPVLSGMIVAYIFNPLANLFDGKVFKNMKNEKTRWKLSVAFALIVLALFITLLCVALIPQLAESISTLVGNMGMYVDSLQQLLKDIETGSTGKLFGLDFSGLASYGDKLLDSIGEYFKNNMDSVVTTSSSIGQGLFDAVIALILAIYFLLDKRRITDGVNKFFSLLMKDESYHKWGDFLNRCNDILIRYIGVDVVDGIVVGIVNFLFMIIMRMPYAALISVIVGVTNLAPTFGPIVGAAIGGFILVLINPWQALWFLIFTIILQTIDGYVLKPRLFGESLGVSALMILISIIIGGRLFGVIGILFAIPFAAIIDFVWKDYVIKKLEQRKAKRYNI